MKKTKTAIHVEELAAKHNITYQENALDKFADVVTELAGDNVTQDPIKDLILALKRAGIIDTKELLRLNTQHLREKKLL